MFRGALRAHIYFSFLYMREVGECLLESYGNQKILAFQIIPNKTIKMEVVFFHGWGRGGVR